MQTSTATPAADFPRARKAKAEAAQAEATARHAEKAASGQPAVRVRVPGRAWDVLSSDGATYYQVWLNPGMGLRDNCPAGAHGKPCRHKRLIEERGMAEEAGERVTADARPFVPVIDVPIDDDPFAGMTGKAALPDEKPIPAKSGGGRWEMPAFYDPFYESEERRRSLTGSLS